MLVGCFSLFFTSSNSDLLYSCEFYVVGDELISPCMCKGTQQFVHRSCLDHWRSVKVPCLPVPFCISVFLNVRIVTVLQVILMYICVFYTMCTRC